MHKLVLALAVAFAAARCAMGQEADSLLRARQANFDRFAARYPQERVYLHFDNTSYYKGGRIWYKAYVVDGGTFRATPLSRILYVELLNPMGYPVETQKLVISDGQADGAFTLSDTINAGSYEVRAYTAWMLNFTPGDRHGWRTLSSRSVCRRYGERFQRYLDGNAGVFSRVFPVYDAVEGGRYAIKRMPRQPKATVSLLERGVKFFPHDENFRQLRLYADVADRRLTYQAGGHRERVYPYSPPGKSFIDSEGLAEMDDTHPLASIFNFITDDRYKDGSSLPEFMGYRINFHGINRPAEFCLPDYSRMPLPEQTDYRRTVYWNPNVTTDADGHATVSFYNNGFSDRLAVSAGGITPDGVAIVQ